MIKLRQGSGGGVGLGFVDILENSREQAEAVQEHHFGGDDGEHQEGDEEGAASAAA
jgi:hypothetical protein